MFGRILKTVFCLFNVKTFIILFRLQNDQAGYWRDNVGLGGFRYQILIDHIVIEIICPHFSHNMI
ncbi:MAG: hypothetical protein C0490_01910, partial [Marivirga sp.]|nr:hypothetical protein [Marivirga sp.]